MNLNIDINDGLSTNAKKLSGIEDDKLIIEKALRLFIAIESQKKLKDLHGKVAIDDEAFK